MFPCHNIFLSQIRPRSLNVSVTGVPKSFHHPFSRRDVTIIIVFFFLCQSCEKLDTHHLVVLINDINSLFLQFCFAFFSSSYFSSPKKQQHTYFTYLKQLPPPKSLSFALVVCFLVNPLFDSSRLQPQGENSL